MSIYEVVEWNEGHEDGDGFDHVYAGLARRFLNGAPQVNTGHWQSLKDVPHTQTRELQNVHLCMVDPPSSVDGLQDYFKPNLPFAEAQFAERVGGVPLNPPPSHRLWPWARHNETHQTQLRVREMDQTDWAYLAGLIDGEGCIHMKKAPSGHIAPRLTITQKDDKYLQTIVNKFGVGVANISDREARPTRPASRRLVWSIQAREEVRWVLTNSLPFLGLKKERAIAALKALPDEPRRNTRPHHEDRSREEGEPRFSHSYPERFWPPRGHGIRYPYGNLDNLFNLLVREPHTRQAYLPVWFPEDGYVADVARERVPCTLGYHFMLRDNRLHIFYPIRSMDFVRYMRDDLYMAARLGLVILNRCTILWDLKNHYTVGDLNPFLNAKLGHINLFASSLHIFEGDVPKLEREYGHG